MKRTIDDFFKPMKLNDDPRGKYNEKIESLIGFVKGFSHVTYQSIYLIDYYKKGFLFVSDNPLFLCGKPASQVLQEGYSFYFKNVPADDLEMLLKINEAGFKFYNTLPMDERLEYFISYDFHLLQPHNNLVLINHKLTPLLLDNDGNIWIALCIISLSPHKKAGNIRIKRNGENKVYEYYMEGDIWRERPVIKLNKQERLILILSSQGYTMEAIATELFLSLDTIKFHKKNIFKKLGVRNISEAITVATDKTII